MQNPFVDSTWKNPVQLESPPREIVSIVPSVQLSAASPQEEKFTCLQRHGNMSLNSRRPVVVPTGVWKVRWRTILQSDFLPNQLLAEGDRIVVQGLSTWQLFSTQGKHLASGKIGGGDVVVDRANKLFYVMDDLGYLVARELRDGSLAFLMGVDLGNQLSRPFITRMGRSLFVLGIGKRAEPHDEPEKRSQIELYDVGDPLRVDSDRMLESFDRKVSLVRRSRILHTAMRDQETIIAAENFLYSGDVRLTLRSAIHGKFVPLAVSLDEIGRIYLILRKENGKLALWVLNRDGERSVDFDLPEGSSGVFAPPGVSYDHRVLLILQERIFSISPQGALEWDRRTAGKLGGITITPDGTLVVSEGSYINAFDARGERRFIHEFPGEQLATQPFVMSGSEIYVATSAGLYLLVREGR